MSRSSRRAEAARMKAAAEKDFVHTAADRVGPLAQSAAERVGPLAEAAADAIGAAADKVSPIAHSAATRVGPLAQSAADRVGPLAQTAADRIAPLAGQAVERVGPYAKLAADRVSPYTQTAADYAQSAAERIAPIAATARLRGTQVTEDARRRFGPVLDDAAGRLGPVVVSARDRVNSDLLARLGVTAGSAIEEVPAEELVVPKRRGRWVKRFAIISALGAVVVVVARRFLGSKDADWQAARPSTPYVPPAPPSSATSTTTDAATAGVAAGSPVSETAGPAGSSALGQPAEGDNGFAQTAADVEEPVAVEEDFAATESSPMTLLNVNDSGDVEETVVDEVVVSEPVPDLPEGEPVNLSPAADKPEPGDRAARWSGEGVYVGTEPPEGYVIKGNGRSMKYHLPEAAGYGRTVAEVWFNSEEAAQQAGFVRAQR